MLAGAVWRWVYRVARHKTAQVSPGAANVFTGRKCKKTSQYHRLAERQHASRVPKCDRQLDGGRMGYTCLQSGTIILLSSSSLCTRSTLPSVFSKRSCLTLCIFRTLPMSRVRYDV